MFIIHQPKSGGTSFEKLLEQSGVVSYMGARQIGLLGPITELATATDGKVYRVNEPTGMHLLLHVFPTVHNMEVVGRQEKAILVRRDPIQAARSMIERYRQHIWMREFGFDEKMVQDAMFWFCYRWSSLFFDHNFLIVDLAEVHRDPDAMVRRIGDYMGVELKGPYPHTQPTDDPRHPDYETLHTGKVGEIVKGLCDG